MFSRRSPCCKTPMDRYTPVYYPRLSAKGYIVRVFFFFEYYQSCLLSDEHQAGGVVVVEVQIKCSSLSSLRHVRRGAAVVVYEPSTGGIVSTVTLKWSRPAIPFRGVVRLYRYSASIIKVERLLGCL